MTATRYITDITFTATSNRIEVALESVDRFQGAVVVGTPNAVSFSLDVSAHRLYVSGVLAIQGAITIKLTSRTPLKIQCVGAL